MSSGPRPNQFPNFISHEEALAIKKPKPVEDVLVKTVSLAFINVSQARDQIELEGS